jgi:predicted HAD superfamily Cof-like phosphohydrolase
MTPTTKFEFSDPDALVSVAAFHKLFRCPILDQPTLPAAERCELRVSLLKEEVQELQVAIQENDLVEVADALADIQYVLSGAVLEFGMGGIFKHLFNEVHRSNMSKACATLEEAEATGIHYRQNKATESYIKQMSDSQWLVYREGDHKALKSVQYSPASLAPILNKLSSTSTELAIPACNTSVAAFHQLFRCPVVETPALPAADRCQLRVSLLEEEVQELQDAIKENDLVEVADALADIQYVLSGAVHEFGMGGIFQELFDEVHRSNMSKACTSLEEVEATKLHYQQNKSTESYAKQIGDQWLVYREGDHKALKSVKYSPASLGAILKLQTSPPSPTSTLIQTPSLSV